MKPAGVFTRRAFDKIVTPTLRAAIVGLKAVGVKPIVKLEEKYEPVHLAVMFGLYKKKAVSSIPRGEIYKLHQQPGRRALTLEQGYFNRKVFRAVGYDSIGGLADFNNDGSPPDRYQRLKKMGWGLRDWQETGSNILMCGQVPWDTTVQHIDYQKWVNETARTIRLYTDRQIVWRPHPLHPKAVQQPDGTKLADTKRPIQEDLKEAWATVVFNSTSSVESVVWGVPTFICDLRTMSVCMPVANTALQDIENPTRHDRTQWAYNMAYAQWSEEEIKAGFPLTHLRVPQEIARLKKDV